MSNSKMDVLKLLFQTEVDNIRFSKQQQWNTIYYSLIAIGGIITLAFNLKTTTIVQCSLRNLLLIINIAISLLGVIYIGIYQWSMARYRCKKNKFEEALLQESPEINLATPECCEILKTFFSPDFFYFVIPFWLVILSIGTISSYIIFYL